MKGPDTKGCMRTRRWLIGLCPCQRLSVCVLYVYFPTFAFLFGHVCACMRHAGVCFWLAAPLARCVSSVIPCPWATDQSSRADSLPAGAGLIKEAQTDPGLKHASIQTKASLRNQGCGFVVKKNTFVWKPGAEFPRQQNVTLEALEWILKVPHLKVIFNSSFLTGVNDLHHGTGVFSHSYNIQVFVLAYGCFATAVCAAFEVRLNLNDTWKHSLQPPSCEKAVR